MMDKFEKEIRLFNCLQKFQVEKSIGGTFPNMVYSILEKANKAQIGEIRIWGGVQYRKEADNEWKKVTDNFITINGKRVPSFNLFKKTFTSGKGTKESRFIEKYGDISFEAAYPIYLKELTVSENTRNKIKDFENFLISKKVPVSQSKMSESRYYKWMGRTYRFSGHVYPTGSMTSDLVVDLAADPELINKINYKDEN